MRSLDPALQARLDTGATTLCVCWRIDRRDGVSLGFTDHDEALEFDGLRFEAATAMAGGVVETALGLAPDTAEIAGALQAGAITEADVIRGRYDGATVRRWTVDWSAPALRALTFRGEIGEITRTGAAFRAGVEGLGAALNRPLGRAYLPTCDARFGDARCGVDAATPLYAAEATVVAVRADGALEVAGLDGYAADWFSRGALVWLSGDEAGMPDIVRRDRIDGGARVLEPQRDMAGRASPGDRLHVTAGCDKRVATCREKFGNMSNFRGFPHLPGDDWLLAGPEDGVAHDGGGRHG